MKKLLKEYIIITIGIIIVATGLEVFFFSNNIASGGVSGLALVLNEVLGVEPGIVMIVCNIILFVAAFIFIGGNFGIKSIYAAFGLSFLLSAVEKIYSPIVVTNNLVLVSIFGSVLVAMGTAIMYTQNATTGGTSIIAKILSKYFHIDFGKALLLSDSIVILLAIYTFGIELGLFGLLSVYLIGTLIDKFIDGFNLSKQVMIFTENEELVANYIINDVGRGCTVFYGKGGYTKKQNCVILTILSRAQFIKLRQFMIKNDSNAFITVNETTEVLGQGFKSILDT
ncbi:YitT family protein [Clostridium taeniosporum]|uniref:YitT family protein n=1 Tax=Clostridium taeniosporum TaxID=394958 RepID=A0A1D7XGR6_9CLOT|nr:YitT family protein [Clostridium taeniosporum]AOR22502.1 YitT family protein [Clostridium taeniosporum]